MTIAMYNFYWLNFIILACLLFRLSITVLLQYGNMHLPADIFVIV